MLAARRQCEQMQHLAQGIWRVFGCACCTIILAAASTAQAHLLVASSQLDRALEMLLLPWISCVCVPLERAIMRLHEQTYTSLSSATASTAESEWLTVLESYASGCASHQLVLLPRTALADTVRNALAGRMMTFFVQQLCLLRPIDDSGRLRLARDCAQLEVALSPLCEAANKLGAPFAQLRALRPLLFATSAEIQAAVQLLFRAPGTAAEEQTAAAAQPAADGSAPDAAARLLQSLRSVGACNLLHSLVARLPRECALPHTHAKMTLRQYSDYLDSVASAATDAALSGASAASSSGPAAASSLALPTDSATDSSVGGISLARAKLFPCRIGLIAVDKAAWMRVSACLDGFVTRLSATATTTGAAAAAPAAVVASPSAGAAAAKQHTEYVVLMQYGQKIADTLHIPLNA